MTMVITLVIEMLIENGEDYRNQILAFYILDKALLEPRPRKKPGSRFMEDTRLDHIWKSLSDGELWAEEEEDDEISIGSLPLHRWKREKEEDAVPVYGVVSSSNHLRPQAAASGRRSVNVFMVSREMASITPVFRDGQRRRGLDGYLTEDPDLDRVFLQEGKHSSKYPLRFIVGHGGSMAGASINPEAMMHFPPLQISPHFRKIFRLCGKFSKFSSAKISYDLFFSHRPRISVHFPPLSQKLLFPPPSFYKFPPLFSQNSPAFYILSVYFVSPLLWPWCIYASPNARTGRPCSVVWFGALRPEDIRFESHSSRYVRTLGKSFTRSCP